eukprot:CAMPEP_0176447904 /NCGR_PEP_ID=MMETSP0127-20121128/25379_1 /TAXON_ID=938130 /ORGANISM="Platyophrya macrostoma, Strain WH" /LENGTH=331 /DNA_ID=CAMNT_0017834579 /DNA_START=3 /DNA_END=994 /DNA_ORIENTATION=+
MASQIRFDGKVVVVAHAGEGLGRQIAEAFASRGAKVVVQDQHNEAADKVVKDIKSRGGNAIAITESADNGTKIIQTAKEAFGRVDVIVNTPPSATTEVSFSKMTPEDWEQALKGHLKSAFAVCQAAWRVMREQSYGKIINFSSAGALYGDGAQSNVSAAKVAIHGLTQTLSKEGEKKNIAVNTVASYGTTRLIEGILHDDILQGMKSEYVVPLVLYLAHESCTETGSLYEAAGGFVSKYRWNRTEGVSFDLPFTAEEVRDEWEKINDFSKNETPTASTDTFAKIIANAERMKAKREQLAATAQPTQAQSTAGPTGSGLKTDNTFQLMNAYL